MSLIYPFLYSKEVKNWRNITDKQVEKVKDYIHSLKISPFEKLMISRYSHKTSLIGFVKNKEINTTKYMVIFHKENKYSLKNEDITKLSEDTFFIIENGKMKTLTYA